MATNEEFQNMMQDCYGPTYRGDGTAEDPDTRNLKAAVRHVKKALKDPGRRVTGQALKTTSTMKEHLGWIEQHQHAGPYVVTAKGEAEHKLPITQLHAKVAESYIKHIRESHELDKTEKVNDPKDPYGPKTEQALGFRREARANMRQQYQAEAEKHAKLAGSDWDESKHPRDENGRFV